MKVLILGGLGVMASSAARDLVKSEEVTQLVLADRTTDTSNVHQSVLSSEKVSTQIVDVADFQPLVNAMKGNDIVINIF